MPDTLTPYKKQCINCGKSEGLLEYLGGGKFAHLNHTAKVVSNPRPRNLEPKVVNKITAAQCLCFAGKPSLLCPYYNNEETS